MNELLSVLLLIVLYILFLLLPMIPAIKMYQLFPSDKIGVKGPLGQLTINASGAFAAYLITAIIGYSILLYPLDLIKEYGMSKRSWQVSAVIELLDTQGKKAEVNESLWKTLDVRIRPDIHAIEKKYVDLNLPELDSKTKITYSIQGFSSVTRKLEKTDSETFEADYTNHKINLGKVVLRQLAQQYNPSPDSTLKPVKTPLTLW